MTFSRTPRGPMWSDDFAFIAGDSRRLCRWWRWWWCCQQCCRYVKTLLKGMCGNIVPESYYSESPVPVRTSVCLPANQPVCLSIYYPIEMQFNIIGCCYSCCCCPFCIGMKYFHKVDIPKTNFWIITTDIIRPAFRCELTKGKGFIDVIPIAITVKKYWNRIFCIK